MAQPVKTGFEPKLLALAACVWDLRFDMKESSAPTGCFWEVVFISNTFTALLLGAVSCVVLKDLCFTEQLQSYKNVSDEIVKIMAGSLLMRKPQKFSQGKPLLLGLVLKIL